MSFLTNAIDNAFEAINNQNKTIKVGDNVVIVSGDYRGETGEVVEETTNLLGTSLLIVKLKDSDDDAYKPCAYHHELRLADTHQENVNPSS